MAGTTTTDYAGNYMYKNNVLQFFNHPEGYVENNAGTYKYHYQYKDHLGNVRLSYFNNGSASSPSLVISQENNYYPFGLNHKGYNDAPNGYGNSAAKMFKFGGKELQDEEFGEKNLDWYDFGARNYDPALGRWMNIDPLADHFVSMTPYNYAYNNPLSFVDFHGKSGDPILSKVVQNAIQNSSASRALERINAAYYEVFNKILYHPQDNPILANIPNTERYRYRGGSGRAMLGRNEIRFDTKFTISDKSFEAQGYYQKKSSSGLLNIDGIKIIKGRNGSRYTTDSFGDDGYKIALTRGDNATIIALSFRDEQTHEVFENLLNKATEAYLANLIAENPELKELFELVALKDEIADSASQFGTENPYDPNSVAGKKHQSLVDKYKQKRRRFNDNSEFWDAVKTQVEESIGKK